MYDVIMTYNDGTLDTVKCYDISHAPDGFLILIDVENEETDNKVGTNLVMIPVRLLQQVTVFKN